MNQFEMHEHRLNLSEVLEWMVADGLVAAEVAEALKVERRMHGVKVHPLVVIADQKWIAPGTPVRLLTLEALTEWLAGRAGLDYLHIDPLKIDFTGVAEVMSSAYAGRFGILPVQVTTREIVIATAEPFVREWVAELQPILRKEIRRVLANPDDISRYLVEFFNLARSVKKAAAKGEVTAGLSSFEQLVELGKGNRQFDANDQHIVHIVNWLWQYAFDQRASDIHIEPRRDLGIVRFRIDGVLHQVYQIPMTVMNAMTSRIKLLGRMDVIEKRRPQDGRIKTRTPAGQEVELRLSTLPTAFGEKLVMRIFDPEVLVRDLRSLGFSSDDEARWNQMTHTPNGIILVTGPTGSGKTTTLYTTLKQLATPEVNVCTIEDPIEMVESAFNQMQVQRSIDLGFADGVRALMRQDPDIRPAQDRFHRRRRRHVKRLRGTLRHPAGTGDDARDRHRHRRALRPRMGRGTAAHPAQGNSPRAGQPGRHFALSGRILQPRPLGQEGSGQGRGDRRAVELRTTGRTGQGQPARSTPTTSISSISSTGCGSTPSTSAPPTSTSSRGATSASSVSASTACCIRCTRSRWR